MLTNWLTVFQPNHPTYPTKGTEDVDICWSPRCPPSPLSSLKRLQLPWVSCRSRVSLESRYGMCDDFLSSGASKVYHWWCLPPMDSGVSEKVSTCNRTILVCWGCIYIYNTFKLDKIGHYKLGNMCVLVSCSLSLSLILTHKWLEESRAMKPHTWAMQNDQTPTAFRIGQGARLPMQRWHSCMLGRCNGRRSQIGHVTVGGHAKTPIPRQSRALTVIGWSWSPPSTAPRWHLKGMADGISWSTNQNGDMKKGKFGGCLMFETSCLPYGVSRISPPTAAAYHLLAQNSRRLSCSVARNQPGPPCSVCPPVTISTNLLPRMMDRTRPHTGPENMWIQCCTRISWAHYVYIYIYIYT